MRDVTRDLHGIRGGQVRTPDLPRITAVEGLEQAIRAEVDDLRIVVRQHDRRVPVEAQRLALDPGSDALRAPRGQIAPEERAELRLTVERIEIARIHEGVETIAAADIEPLDRVDPAQVARRMRAAPRAVVLGPTEHAERFGVVNADRVELRQRQVVEVGPRFAAVPGDVQPAVIAKDQLVRVIGPQNPKTPE